MKPSKEEFAELQAAKDLLYAKGVLSERENHAIQNKLDNLKAGKNRMAWGTRFKEVEEAEWRRDLLKGRKP